MCTTDLQDGDGVVEVMVLHSGGRVDSGEGGGALLHELIRVTTVIHVVT